MGSAMLPDIQGRRLGAYQNAPQPGSQTSNEYGYLSPEAYYAQRFEALSPYMTETGTGNAVPNAAGYGASQYQTQNMQDTKQAFYSDSFYPDPGNATLSGAFLEDDTIWNGTIIPGVLITGINTDLPGDVMARVTENVYDSKSGKKLLVPQGSILIAKYNSSVSFAQERVQIAWTTLIRPDGYQVGLGNMNGVDNQGFSGIHGSVDNHFWQYVKAAGIISAFTILNGEINYSRTAQENQSIQNLIAANQAVMNQLSAEIINRVLNIQPTITVNNGTKINIFCNTAIRLPPVPDYPAAGVYTR
jgi:type IV secretion system protein VirB10